MILLTACSSGNKLVLEQKDVQFFQVVNINEKPTTLKISGLAFHSALAVSEIITKEKESSLLILVYLTPARAGLSGSFNFEVSIPDRVNDVRFGNDRTIIWSRNQP